jgi:hypothetical protein
LSVMWMKKSISAWAVSFVTFLIMETLTAAIREWMGWTRVNRCSSGQRVSCLFGPTAFQ